jgi:hypothetical protein
MLSSQPDPRRILTYGHDSVLLETRRLLLEQGGFPGDTANTLQEFEARIAETQASYGLYVLCHRTCCGATCDCRRRFEGEHRRVSAHRCDRTPRIPH